jgi:hypothetical protein
MFVEKTCSVVVVVVNRIKIPGIHFQDQKSVMRIFEQ